MISDHALLRYMERCKGIDLAAIRRELLEKLQPAIKAGASATTVDGAKFYIAKNGVVCTCVRNSENFNRRSTPKSRKRRRQSRQESLRRAGHHLDDDFDA